MGKSEPARFIGGTCEVPAYNTLTPCGPTQPPGRLSPVPWITWSTRGYRGQGGEALAAAKAKAAKAKAAPDNKKKREKTKAVAAMSSKE